MEQSKLAKGLVTLAMITLVLLLMWYLRSVVAYILISAVLAIVGRPLVKRLSRVKLFGRELSRNISAGITLILLWIIIGCLGVLFVPLVMGKVNELASIDWDTYAITLKERLQVVENYINSFSANPIIENTPKFDIIKFIQGAVSRFFLPAFTNAASVLISLAIGLFSITFITFFFLRDEGLFYKIVAIFFPEHYRENIYHALDSITTLLSLYFRGLLVESSVIMPVISASMMICGMEMGNALMTGLIMGTMNLVPYAGPVIGCCIVSIMGAIYPIDGNIGYTLIVIVTTVAVVKIIDDFIIQPSLYSKRVNAHPLEVFIVILISGHIAGVVGMLLAIPLYTVLRVIASEFFSEYGVVRRLTGKINE
jgi:predicted PurR-regulated permease PerM